MRGRGRGARERKEDEDEEDEDLIDKRPIVGAITKCGFTDIKYSYKLSSLIK
jgi:hypothetical protein